MPKTDNKKSGSIVLSTSFLHGQPDFGVLKGVPTDAQGLEDLKMAVQELNNPTLERRPPMLKPKTDEEKYEAVLCARCEHPRSVHGGYCFFKGPGLWRGGCGCIGGFF
jgi:hypothetical protein